MDEPGVRCWRRIRSLARCVGVVAALLLLATFSLAQARGDEGAGGSSGKSTIQSTTVIPAHRQADKIAVLPIRGEIDQVTLYSLERRIQQAKDDGYEAVVIELDTPGGELYATLDIINLIKTDAPVNTVAWVNPRAFSAGTLIALACSELVVHEHAVWGDAAPIAIQDGGLVPLPSAERAKLESPLRQNVVDSARRHGYDERLVQAFISTPIALWMLENTSTGERIFVTAQEYQRIYGEEPPNTAPNSSGGEGTVLPEVEDGRSAGQQPGDGTSRQQSTASQRPDIDTIDPSQWKLARTVVGGDELLVLDASDSITYGLATAIVSNDEELKAYFKVDPSLRPGVQLRRYEVSWSESLVRFLLSGWVRGLLAAVFIVALFLELAMAGIGVFGAVAGVALLLFLGAPLLVGMAEWWEILLIFGGFVLILVEIFVMPGFGVAGIGGVLCLLVGMVGTFVSGDVTTTEGQAELFAGILWTLIAILGGAVGLWILSRFVYDIPVFRRLILSATTSSVSTAAEQYVEPASDADTSLVEVGDVGQAVTSLRPAGRAMINGRMMDVVAAGGWIESGTPVRISALERFRTVVEPADS